ncbi:MAG: ArsR family transcriptional regulator [Bacteroidales bacterium]|nr:ArsR family transcriptional regulator [Bacteroidales bacterium]
MEVEKGKTFKYLREKKGVNQEVKDNLKHFTKIKKVILDALKEKDLTVEELTQQLKMPKHEVVYYLMSLVKYGFVKTGVIDDMDEYFNYKISK